MSHRSRYRTSHDFAKLGRSGSCCCWKTVYEGILAFSVCLFHLSRSPPAVLKSSRIPGLMCSTPVFLWNKICSDHHRVTQRSAPVMGSPFMPLMNPSLLGMIITDRYSPLCNAARLSCYRQISVSDSTAGDSWTADLESAQGEKTLSIHTI